MTTSSPLCPIFSSTSRSRACRASNLSCTQSANSNRDTRKLDTAASVADGIARFQEKSYDILLSDLGLPDGTGLDLIRKVREQSKIPAVALTGYGMDEDVARCKEAGFDAHLTKPLNFQELDALIRKLT